MTNRFRLLSILLLCTLSAFSQSKKEQIEALNHSVDSLNTVLTTTRDNSTKKVGVLNTTIVGLNSEIAQLKSDVSSLESSATKLTKENSGLKTDLGELSDEIQELEAKLFAQLNYPQTVTIGAQVWTTKNLDVSTFRNGDPIPQVKTHEEWQKAGDKGQPAWCYYNNDPANGVKYGKLYNWYAINDARGLAPQGFHVPSNAEWTTLENHLGDNILATGKKMKSTSGWEDSYQENANGTNESGFSGLPGGFRDILGPEFIDKGSEGYFWSSTECVNPQTGIIYTDFAFNRNLVDIFHNGHKNSSFKKCGLSVRCLRD
jgi:uncharacterized protein (TIGR02145 family)